VNRDRNVAALESPDTTVAFNRRSATAGSYWAANRRLKPTAIVTASLREATRRLKPTVSRTLRIFPACVALAVRVLAAELEPNQLPPAAAISVDYARDIKPIFETTCFRCHGPEKPKSKFRLDNRESALKGGENNTNNIVPGKSAESLLIYYVAGLVEDMEMPPPGKGERLTAQQIGFLRAWIDQGANWSAEALVPRRETKFTVVPTTRYLNVDGDRRKFREDWWQKEGFSAGYERFDLSQPVGKDAELQVEGRAIFEQNDYRVGLSLSQPDLGFVRTGYSVYRKYFDDSGGYYRPYGIAPSSLDLDRDLHVDVGRAWFDVGLSLPDLPRLVLGYEYQFRDGNKSSLAWGQVTTNQSDFFGKAIRPAARSVNEKAHVIKFDGDYQVAGVRLEDSLRVEFYDTKSVRTQDGYFTPGVIAVHDESYRHFQAANSFRLEKQVRDWWRVSGGYLYTHLDGDGAFSQMIGLPGFLAPGDESQRIALQQQAHAINVNTMLGPWEGLTLSTGIQSEWMRREGLSRLLVQGFPAAVPAADSSNVDKWTLEEDVAVRYNKIPFTVLYAEGRFQQEQIDHFESGFIDDGFDDSRDFVRDTDATSDLRQYRAGFTFSPVPRVSLESSYKRREKTSDYDHLTDSDGSQPPFSLPGNGYPAFIVAREVRSDEIEAKLVLRCTSWLKTTLKYQLVSTDYESTMASGILPSFPTNLFYPGGEILGGNQDAHVYSLNATLTPWRRLYLSTTFSYSTTRIVSGVNNDTLIAPFKGDVYSVLTSANFTLDDKTALRGSYSFSRADYAQDNEDGLPLGIRYDRHGLNVGLTRRFTKNLTGTAQYGFFQYFEPTAAGANDYSAHAVFASLSFVLP